MTEVLELIVVRPVSGGWSVVRARDGDCVAYPNGAVAEAAARQLGKALARGGAPAEIRIYLRDGTLAGRFACTG